MRHLTARALLATIVATAAVVLAAPVAAPAATLPPTPASPATAAQTDTPSNEPDPTDPAADPGSLPFTGSPLAPVLMGALLLVVVGLGVRRSVRVRS